MTKAEQELTLSGIAGFITLGLTIVLWLVGVTPIISVLPVVILGAVVVSYFAFVLFRAPAKLDQPCP